MTEIEKLPIVYYYKICESAHSSSDNIVYNDEDGQGLEQLTDRLEPSPVLIYGNVRPGVPIVLWFGHKESSLRTKLIEYFLTQDVVLILFLIEEGLWQWLNSNASLTIVSLILQPTKNGPKLIDHSHSYVNVRSILVYCTPAELVTLERFTRTYPKVDEELGDHYREDENNELEAQRNYDRALSLCTLVKDLNLLPA